jgi:hypothetical protein
LGTYTLITRTPSIIALMSRACGSSTPSSSPMRTSVIGERDAMATPL